MSKIVTLPGGIIKTTGGIITKEATLTNVLFGFLYNTMAVNDVRGLVKPGYRVASVDDWNNLSTYLGGDSVAGGKLKSTDPNHWNAPNNGATNEVGFNAKGTGERAEFAGFAWFKEKSWYLTSTTGDWYGANYRRAIENYEVAINIPFRMGTNKNGYPVRIVKISTTLQEGATGTYQGNDGKIYQTKCINGIEWCLSELAETKWRDGSFIKGFDDGVYTPILDIDWAALTEAALCAMNDNVSNVVA